MPLIGGIIDETHTKVSNAYHDWHFRHFCICICPDSYQLHENLVNRMNLEEAEEVLKKVCSFGWGAFIRRVNLPVPNIPDIFQVIICNIDEGCE